MDPTNVLTDLKLNKLTDDLRAIISDGRLRASKAAQQQVVLTYWQIGKRIAQEELSEYAGYKQSILRDLSKQLKIDLSTLKRCVYFFNTYKSAPRGTDITWAQYKELITIEDSKEREFYEELLVKEKLNRDQLVKAIKSDRFSEFQDSGVTDAQILTIIRPVKPTYLYKAIVKNVIDGDTLLLHIDLGFQVLKEQRVRLAEIDTPPLDESRGQEAAHFVQNTLAKTEFVMVKTNKIDIYGRYVGYIFYSFNSQEKDKIFLEGNFLNQELVTKGYAKIV